MNCLKMICTIIGRKALIPFGFLFLPLVFSISCGKNNSVFPEEEDGREQMTLTEEPDDTIYEEVSEPEYTKVNVFNRDLLFPGYNHFRIPAIVTTNQGTL